MGPKKANKVRERQCFLTEAPVECPCHLWLLAATLPFTLSPFHLQSKGHSTNSSQTPVLARLPAPPFI